MIPIILVVSYYIGLQINTITMQKNYTVKLQTAAKDSIQALEINTVEWNSASSNLADSKRRDVLAAINTFTTSLANGMGIGGAGKGRIQTYIPAIVYTMYDGYYIYSASLMKDQKTDNNGLTQFNDDGTIESSGKSYQYILKPYSPYSARYVSGSGSIDVTVNYTLDNYIRVYGTINGEYQTKEGYLVVCSDEGVKGVTSGSISGIEYRGAEIKPEKLKENVYADGKVGEYSYIYDQYDNKLYLDNDKDNYFSVDKYNNKVYLQDALPEGDAGFSITNRFRKISIPMLESEWTVQKVFQILNPGGDSKFYYENESGAFVEFTAVNVLGNVNKDEDYSAINYCVESYVFTQWVTKNLGNITVDNMISTTEGQYNNVESEKYIFRINENNNPDPENDTAYANSVLAQHKKDIIINTIEKNLSQATAQAQGMNPNYEYRLPQLSYDEWEQALSNISIIAFMQGMPIGLKYYNNYAIATSTLNKEFVDPDELYFAGKDDQYYHQRQCEQATGSDYVGYRSIDYVAKSYEESGNGITSTYYPHAHADVSNSSTDSVLECYYCLVNRSTYKTGNKEKEWNNSPYNNWTDSYYNALARERYMQLDEPGTYKPNVTVTKTASASSVEYGDSITYTITITNKGIVDDTITFLDYWNTDELNREESDITVSSTKNRGSNKIEIVDWNDNNNNNLSGISSVDNVGIYIYAGETITITYKAIPKGTLGKNIKNTAVIYSFTNKDIELDRGTATTTVKKTIKVAKTEVKQKNVILVVDTSSSMRTYLSKSQGTEFKVKVKKFVEELKSNNISVSQIRFNLYAYDDRTVDNNDFWNIWAGTNYKSALEKAYNKINDNKNNILVFFSDGDPTYPGLGFPGYTYNERGTILGRDNLAKKTWNGVEAEISKIKQKGVIVYAIGFTNQDADSDKDGNDEKNANFEGLKEVFVTKEEDKFINAKNHDNLLTAFDDIATIITSELDVPDTYTTANNKLELKETDKIQSIKIGESVYGKAEAKEQRIIIEENGKTYLNLEMVDLNQEITIYY